MPKKLTEAQIGQFHSEGYVYPFRAVSAEQADDYRKRIEAYEAQAGLDANRTLKIKGYLAFPWLVELAKNPAILDAVQDIIGPNILLFGASIFAKNGRAGHCDRLGIDFVQAVKGGFLSLPRGAADGTQDSPRTPFHRLAFDRFRVETGDRGIRQRVLVDWQLE